MHIINHDAEKSLLSSAEKNDPQLAPRSAFHFFASKLARRPLEEEILLMVRPLLQNTKATVYFFRDGDIVIAWSGAQTAILDSLRKKLYGKFCHMAGEKGMDSYYDFGANGEKLREMCSKKIAALSPASATQKKNDGAHPVSHSKNAPGPAREQIEAFREVANARSHRDTPVVLVVEDTNHYRSMILRVLGHSYTVHVAASGENATGLYLEHAPDIVFLDIGLPEGSGHDFASMITGFDTQAFIVMVTGNNFVEDINRAKQNGAKGFIVKPYSKQKVMDSIQRFLQERKAQREGK